jgi:predicted anti-sigma-YlaC factor YlaD
MKCEIVRAQMTEALDNALDARKRTEHFAHLRQCTSCREQWAALQRVDDLFRDAVLFAPAPGFTARFQQRLARQQSRLWNPLSALFVVLSALLMSGLVFVPASALLRWLWEGMQDPARFDSLKQGSIALVAGVRVLFHLFGTVVPIVLHYTWWLPALAYGLLAIGVAIFWIGAFSLRWRSVHQRSV